MQESLHFKRRLKERLGVKLTTKELLTLRSMILSGKASVVDIKGDGCTIYGFKRKMKHLDNSDIRRIERQLYSKRNELLDLLQKAVDASLRSTLQKQLEENRTALIDLPLPDLSIDKAWAELELEHKRSQKRLNPREELETFEASELVKTLYAEALNTQDQQILNSLYCYYAITSNRPNYQVITDQDIAKAKEHDIYEVVELQGIPIIRSSCSCIFHQEKTASMHLYPKTNSFHCFGCSESGDVIKLYRKLTGSDFKNAVNFLKNC